MKRQGVATRGEYVVFSEPEYRAAIIGTTYDGRVVYDYDKMSEILAERENWTREQSEEYLDHNTVPSLPYIEGAPIVMFPISDEEEWLLLIPEG